MFVASSNLIRYQISYIYYQIFILIPPILKTLKFLLIIFLIYANTYSLIGQQKSYSTQDLERTIKAFVDFEGYTLKKRDANAYIVGDFFGDNIDDLAILLEDDNDNVVIGIINYGKTIEILFPGKEDDSFKAEREPSGKFIKVNKGEVLWSNYINDFRDFKDVPDKEKVILTYDAIYVHADESCGGGFIFWKDGKFNWLLQE